MAKHHETVFIGDLHLDRIAAYFPSNHLDLQMTEIRKPLDYAIRKGVRHVVFLGDLSEREFLSEEAKIEFYLLLVQYDGRLDIDIILGNHDVAHEELHSLQFLHKLCETGKFKSIRIFVKPQQVKFNGIPFNFLPFPATKPLPYDGPCDKTVNVAHLERPGALRDNGYKIKKGHGVRQRKEDSNLWFIGHLHTPQTLGLNYFSGTLYQLNFGESLPKGFIHAKFRLSKGRLHHKVIRVPNDPAFKLITLKVEKRSDLKQIDDNPLHLYKVLVKKGVKLKYDLATKHKNLWNAPVQYDTEKEAALLMDEGESEEISFGLTDGLDSELKNMGASKWQIKRGYKLVKKFQSQPRT